MSYLRLSSLVVVLALASPSAQGHSGGTNAQGCHNQRSNGTYHCHGNKAPSSQSAPPAALYGTQPARNQRAYANCTEARNAGAAPVRRGDPGYGSHLDRDNDGVGCE